MTSISTTVFSLQPSESNTIAVPPTWSGRLWGRTLCSQDSPCVTDNCAFSTVECTGGNATPLATLAEFTLNGADGLDFFDVSLANGYNLPVTVEPEGGNCTCPRANVDGTRNFTCACASADYLIIFCATPTPSSVELGNQKYPTSVNNNSEGQVDGSTNNIIPVALVVASIICGLLACKITFFCSKKNCGIHVVAGTRSETSVPGPQPVTA